MRKPFPQRLKPGDMVETTTGLLLRVESVSAEDGLIVTTNGARWGRITGMSMTRPISRLVPHTPAPACPAPAEGEARQ